MNLNLTDQRFIVCGASSGFGRAVTEALLDEGARCIVTARRGDMLKENFSGSGDRIEIIEGDLTRDDTLDKIVRTAKNGALHGIVLNAGGPPTNTPLETDMNQWDESYRLVMRWKIDLTLRLAPLLVKNGYGRILFLESKTVKEPIPALVLSNAFRAGIIGFTKSLALEVAKQGVTVNVIAPGIHDTPAIERLIKKNAETQNISSEEARRRMAGAIPVGRMGVAGELASLALWLLSSQSSYITGQTISHDGGAISGIFG